MRARVGVLGLIGALAAAGCAEQVPPQKPLTGQDANVIVCAPGSYTNGNECLPVKNDCPSGTRLQDGSCVALAVAGDPAPPPPDPPPAPAVAAPTGLEAILDARRGRLQPRSRLLLITELQGLEALYASVPKDAADRPKLMRRLAEGYVELSAAAVRDGQATAMGSEVSKMAKIEQAARMAAIKYYQQLVDQYPKLCAVAPNAGCSDEALYYLSIEYARAGKRDHARKTLLQLLQNHPQSSFVGHAYFQFGEMFFAEATQDPSKWALAEQSYLETARRSSSPVAPYAMLRLAEVYARQGDSQKAEAMRKKLAAQFPGSDAAGQAPSGP